MAQLYIVLFTLSACFIGYGSTIMCYECNSVKTKDCANAIPPESLRHNCSQNEIGVRYTLCRKIVQHVDYRINGELPQSRTVRACGWDDSKYKDRCYHRYGYGGRQEVCSCATDFCNTGHLVSVLYGLLLPSIFVIVVQ